MKTVVDTDPVVKSRSVLKDSLTLACFSFVFVIKMVNTDFIVSPSSATRHDSRHQNKVRVKDLGRNSSYLAGDRFFFMVL